MQEQIEKNLRYKQFSDMDSVDDVVSSYASSCDEFRTKTNNIVKDLNYSEYIKEMDAHSMLSIEEFKQKKAQKVEEEKEEKKRLIEESKKIEEPIDLSYVEEFMLMPEKERRVNYKRTFGITKSRKKDINKYTSIALIISAGVLVISYFILQHLL